MDEAKAFNDVRCSEVVLMPKNGEELSKLYDAKYYQIGCGPVPYDRSEPRWSTIFSEVASHLAEALHPKKVLDAGCAMGFLVEALWDLGIEAWGIDISPYAIQNTRRDMRPYCRVGDIAKDIDGSYDLITCIEVLEHLPADAAVAAVERMCRCADTVLFSSTPYDFAEPTHFNVRPLMYWLTLFQKCGFDPDLLFDASFVVSHAMLLRRSSQPWPVEVLKTFANLLRVRQSVVNERNHCNEALRATQETEARWGDEMHRRHLAHVSELEGLRATLVEETARIRQEEAERLTAALQAKAAEFDQVLAQTNAQTEARWGDEMHRRHLAHLGELEALRATIEDVARELIARKQRDLGMAESQKFTEQLNSKIGELRHSQEDTSRQLLIARSELDNLSSSLSELHQRIGLAKEFDGTLVDRVSRTHHDLTQLALKVNSIVESRIWRALVWTGGVLLRLTGRPLGPKLN